MRVFESPDEVVAAVGTDLGASEWVEITQERVDAFADATGDHQWIHVDPERAMAGPFAGTIVHGYLTLSLVPWLGSQVFTLGGDGAALNYGTNKVRFPQPDSSRTTVSATQPGLSWPSISMLWRKTT